MPTLTSISIIQREPKVNFENWQKNDNTPKINEQGFNELKATAKAGSGFGQAWMEYKDSPKIQNVIEKHDLKNKDWEFTLDKSGDIRVIEGNDKLTKQAVKDLEQTLNDSAFGYHFKDMAVGLIGKSQLSVNTYNNPNSMTKYDIHTENMADILRGRELMEQPNANWSNVEEVFSRQIDRAADSLGLREKTDLIYRSIEVEV